MLNIGHIWRVQLLYLICLLSHEQKNVDSFFVPNISRPFSSNSFSILPLYQPVGNAFSATTCKTRLFSGPDQCHRKSVEWGIKNNPKLTWSKGPPTQQTVRHSRKYGNINKKHFCTPNLNHSNSVRCAAVGGGCQLVYFLLYRCSPEWLYTIYISVDCSSKWQERYVMEMNEVVPMVHLFVCKKHCSYDGRGWGRVSGVYMSYRVFWRLLSYIMLAAAHLFYTLFVRD